MKILFRKRQGVLNAIRLGLQFKQGRMLGLSARAAMIDHELLRDRAGDLGAKVFLDHRQREVDTGRHARRRPHIPVDDKNPVFFQFHHWKPGLKFARMPPMGGRALAIQNARFRENESAGADRCDAARMLQYLAHEGKQGGRGIFQNRRSAADDHGVVAGGAKGPGVDDHARR